MRNWGKRDEEALHDGGVWHALIAVHAACLLITVSAAPFVRRTLVPDHIGPVGVWGPEETRAPNELGGPRDAVAVNYWVFHTFGVVMLLIVGITLFMTCCLDEFLDPEVELELRSAPNNSCCESSVYESQRGEELNGTHLRFRSVTTTDSSVTDGSHTDRGLSGFSRHSTYLPRYMRGTAASRRSLLFL